MTGGIGKLIATICTFALATGISSLALATDSGFGGTLYVDDDAIGDPAPGDPLVSDPLEDGSVDHPYDEIQEAIDAAADGGDVVVLPGTYTETIDLFGKAITVRGQDGPEDTVLDATGLGDSAVKCINGEGPNTLLEGFTITGGSGCIYTPYTPGNAQGGGMLCIGSSPTVRNCVFRENHVFLGGNDGGGMLNYESSPTVIDCVFEENSTSVGYGGGVFNRDNSSPLFVNCRFLQNSAGTHAGGGMANHGNCNPIMINCVFVGNFTAGFDYPHGGAMNNRASSPYLVNCTFVGNWANGNGGGIRNFNGSFPEIQNCILWGNHDAGGTDATAQIHDQPDSAALVEYSDVQGGWTGLGGLGNIDLDPMFLDPLGPDGDPGTSDGDYRLSFDSPGVDAGDSAAVPADIISDLDGNPRIVGCCVDMGAYESGHDCNDNGVSDGDDLASGYSADCNANGIPDECDEDADGDGIPYDCDACRDSAMNETIQFGSCDTGVENLWFDDGCTMQDELDACADNASNHGQFVSCVAHLTNDWRQAGLITGREKGRIQRCAARSGNVANHVGISSAEALDVATPMP